jgi:four helix bundle protein
VSAIKRFEDIEAWQRARVLVREVYAIARTGSLARDFGLRDQLQRAAVSAMSNIAEGYERDSNREFRRFLAIAKGSTGEVRSLLYVALDLAYIDEPTHQRLHDEGTRLSRQIARFMSYLDSRAD